MHLFPGRWKTTCWRLMLALPVTWTLQTAVGQDAMETPSEGQADCTVHIEGQHIARLVLTTDEHGQEIIDSPSESVSLPGGKYAVEEVHLEGGYTGRHPEFRQDWFTLTPDAPHELRFGGPLTPAIAVTRQRSTFLLDYSLVDAEGFEYQGDATEDPPPRFVVYQDGQEIGSGTFSYG